MSKIAAAIQEFADATPRIVADLENVTFEIRHMRDDVEGQYSETDLNKAYRLVMGTQVSSDEFKQLVGAAQYQAQSLFFDTIIVFVFPSSRYQAVFASFDYREDFPVSRLIRHVSEIDTAE